MPMTALKPFSLTNAIAYQEGSVVSKELLRKDSATITLFAFDKGQGLSEHKTPYDAFASIIDGEAEITVSGVKYIVKQGEMLPMSANEPHALKALARFKMMLIMIK